MYIEHKLGQLPLREQQASSQACSEPDVSWSDVGAFPFMVVCTHVTAGSLTFNPTALPLHPPIYPSSFHFLFHHPNICPPIQWEKGVHESAFFPSLLVRMVLTERTGFGRLQASPELSFM